MRPFLFSLGPFHLYSFGAAVALGVMTSLFLMTRASKKENFLSSNEIFDLVFITVLSGFFSARLYFVLQNWEEYKTQAWQIFAIWEGGLIFYGGVIGSFLAVCIYFKFKKIRPLRGLDFLLPYIALAHAFGRIGCFLNGCCGGKACSYFFCVLFPETPAAVHPAQLYETCLDLMLFLLLRRFYKQRRFDGQITALYFILYSAGRFLIEFFRDGNPGWGMLTWNQWIAAAFMAVFSGVYFYQSKKKILS